MSRSRTEDRLRRAMQARELPVRPNAQIDRYEVDFLVGERTVVEVDGYHHLSRRNRERDARKDAHLERLGYQVFRIPAAHVWLAAERRHFLRRLRRHLVQSRRAAQRGEKEIPPLSPGDRDKLRRLREQLRRADRGDEDGGGNGNGEESAHRLMRRHLRRHFPRGKNSRRGPHSEAN